MSLTWPAKDPDEVLDYQVKWEEWLDGDTIAASTWTVPAGITKNSDAITNGAQRTTIWLSGGTKGASYEILNRIQTVAGRTAERTVKLRVRAR